MMDPLLHYQKQRWFTAKEYSSTTLKSKKLIGLQLFNFGNEEEGRGEGVFLKAWSADTSKQSKFIVQVLKNSKKQEY